MRTVLIPFLMAILATPAVAGVEMDFTRPDLEAQWRARVQSFLNAGRIPLIDLQSSLKRNDGEAHLDAALDAMDELGVALIAFEGFWNESGTGGWGYYVHEVVNRHPDSFILATNGGNNPDWAGGGDGFIAEAETQVRSGDYPIMGEFEFRHYMSARQCKKNRTERDVTVPMDGPNGHRLFRLSSQTGIPFLIHNEPEDEPLEALERMLRAYPRARVINAHFGQLRAPSRQTHFGPGLVRRLLETYPNLSFDLATGKPGRRYKCDPSFFDTVIWQVSGDAQENVLDPAYAAILSDFSTRFVVGFDYGGGRQPMPRFLEAKAGNIRLILSGLPDAARHDIAYRNAWKLLTGKDWTQPNPVTAVQPPAAEPYGGVISDGHAHLKGSKADPDETIKAMDRNGIDKVVLWVKRQGGWTDDHALAFKAKYPGRVAAGIAFQNEGWTKAQPGFLDRVHEKAASGEFQWLGELSVRGKIGGKANSAPDSLRIRQVLDIAVEFGLPLTVHHNPYKRSGGAWVRTGEYETFIEKSLAYRPDATVVWAHWCGISEPAGARRLLERFPNLHCELAWIHKPSDELPNRLVDGSGRFLPQWKAVIEDFPGRFIMGVDSAANPGSFRDYDRRVGIMRTALGGLKQGVAAMVATGNFHRLIGRE